MKSLIHKKYKLHRMPGKGGWTYAVINDDLPAERQKGQLRVKGTIDGYEIKQYHLLPIKGGDLFLPVKEKIRKAIGKKEGDWVEVTLYHDDSPVVVPDELQMCLYDEPRAQQFFYTLTDSERKYYIDWIYSAKRLETRDNRIAQAVNKLAKKLKLHQKEE